jgi:hypothetical protein
MMQRLRNLVPLALLAGMCSLAQGGVILLVNGGTGTDPVAEPMGESFTTPGGGSWNNITFNFFSDVPASTPLAAGNAYLLTQEYLGSPGSLSSLTPGFLAESVSVSGGQYIFDSSVFLSSNTEYWLYEDTNIQTTGDGLAGSSAGQAYFGGDGGFDLRGVGQIANFELDGVSTAAPEPGTWLTGFTGLAILGLVKSGLVKRGTRRSTSKS